VYAERTQGTDRISLMNETSLKEHQDVVLRKLGRNVLNLQRIEAILKALVASSGFEGPVEELHARKKALHDSVKTRPMGRLIEDLFRTLYSQSQDSASTDEVLVPWFSFKTRIETDEKSKKEFKRALNLMAKERNQLIHRMLAEFDHTSLSTCEKMSAALDAQNEKILPVFKELLLRLKSLEQMRKEAMKAIESEMLKDQ